MRTENFRLAWWLILLLGISGSVFADSSVVEAPTNLSTALAFSTTTNVISGMDRGDLPSADRLLVRKTERRLYLLRRGQVLRSYPVRLGLRPDGRKEFEGDFRTPEGHYNLGKRNPHSDYFLSIQVTYPNADDIRRARRQGLQPGGAIMIHGLPNSPRKPMDYYNRIDWTDGCIAVANSDMVEIWLMTAPGTPIDIVP